MVLLNGYRPLNFTGKHLVSFVGPFANKGRQEVDIENGLLYQCFQLVYVPMEDFSNLVAYLIRKHFLKWWFLYS